MQNMTTKMGSSTNHDQGIWEQTLEAIESSKIGVREVVEDAILFQRRVNFAKHLTHIELFKKQIDLPGSIVELGVFKGASLLTFAKLCEIYCPGDTLKKVIGFDTFTGFPELSEKDGKENLKRDLTPGGFNSSYFEETLRRMIDINQQDSMIPRFQRVHLVKGDVVRTVPDYVKQNPGLRISLLHLDLDIYEPTLTALKCLYPLVVPGGVVLLDEYGMEGFPGESAAFDEYFGSKRPVLKKFPFISTPGGYFIKES